jgi:hypothetical protein
LVGGGVDYGFHEAARFVGFESAGDVGHGHFGHADFFVLGAGFGFCEADAAEFGIGKKHVGDEAAVDGGVSIFEDVGAQDAEIVVGNVGEGRAAFDVSESEDARRGGFQFPIYFNVATVIDRDAGGGNVQRIGVGSAAGGDEQVRAVEDAGFVADLDGEMDFGTIWRDAGRLAFFLGARLGDARGLRVQHYLDAVLS